ncbi:MAG: sulfite exporter TauE/SafE family protein [Clostridia bacterium]|nr:sulfite exporter TauE/SafE family protein [Clostridia bacterium]
MLAVCSLAALLAGLVQGIAGFGSGPVQMMVYPLYWAVPAAAAVSVCVSVPLNLNMTITYLKEIHWKKVLVPILPYMAICSAAISFSLGVDQVLIKRVFGVFLILLAAYYLFFNRGVKKRLGPWQTAAYILISALCDAFFGIGGPMMVIYFLNKTDSAKEYLGTAAAFFLINGVYNTVYRLISGILAPALLPYIGVGAAAILAGVTLAHLVAKKLNDRLIKKAVYIMIGLTGIFNLFA